MRTNKIFYIFSLISILFIGCKKDTKVEPTIADTKLYDERFKIITSHYWRLDASWQDTTFYGLNNPSLIPLSTSTQVYYPADSCQYYSSSKYSSSGWYYSVKKNGCGVGCSLPCCEIFENIHWGISKDGKTLYGASGNYKIIDLNDSLFKHYDIEIYNFTIKTITVRIYKAIKY